MKIFSSFKFVKFFFYCATQLLHLSINGVKNEETGFPAGVSIILNLSEFDKLGTGIVSALIPKSENLGGLSKDISFSIQSILCSKESFSVLVAVDSELPNGFWVVSSIPTSDNLGGL